MDINALPIAKLGNTTVEWDDEGKPKSGFKWVSSNSDDYQNAEREFQVGNLKKSAIRGAGIDARQDEGANELADALKRQEKMLTYACIKEVYGFTDNGQPATRTDEILDRIFKARPMWLRKVLEDIRAERPFTTP